MRVTCIFVSPRRTRSGAPLTSLFDCESLRQGGSRKRLACLYQGIHQIPLEHELHGTLRVAEFMFTLSPTRNNILQSIAGSLHLVLKTPCHTVPKVRSLLSPSHYIRQLSEPNSSFKYWTLWIKVHLKKKA